MTATSWEDLEIQEEAESGNNVTSKIRLPVQVSSTYYYIYIYNLIIIIKSNQKLLLPAAVLVRAVAAVPAVRGGEQSRGACSAPAHSAGAATGLSEPGSPAVPQSCATA